MPGFFARLVFTSLICCVLPVMALALTAQERAVGECVARAMALEGGWYFLASEGVSGADEAAAAARIRADRMLRRATLSHVGISNSEAWHRHLSVSLSGALLRLRLALEAHPRRAWVLDLEARRLRRDCAGLAPENR